MKSLRGVAPEGKSMDPGELPEGLDEAATEPKAAPAPGLPISEEEYKRMKEAAKHAPAPRVKEAQKDRSKRDRKRGTRHR